MSFIKNINRKRIIFIIVGLLLVVAMMLSVGVILMGADSFNAVTTTEITQYEIHQPVITIVREPVCNYTAYKNPNEFHRIYYK